MSFRATPVYRVVCLAVALIVGGTSAHADVIRVPQDVATVQGAVDLAQDGDQIRISKGTYFESVVIHERMGLRLVGKGKVVLHGGLMSSMTVSGSDDIVLERLTFANSARHGLQVSDVRGLRVSRCRSIGNTSSGMIVDSSEDVRIERCRLEFNGGYGIRLVGTDHARIEKNKIQFSGIDGVELIAGGAVGSHDAVVSRNTIKDAGRHGIAVFGVAGHVQQNKIMGVGLEGLVGTSISSAEAAPAIQTVFVRNRVKHAGRDGIRLAGFGGMAEGNLVADCAGVGIQARGSGGHAVVSNKVLRAGDVGLAVLVGADGCTLHGNRLSHSGADGLDLQSAGNLVTGNRCVSSTEFGYRIGAGGNTLRKNRGARSGVFDLSDRVGGNTYDGNVFKKVDPEGVVPD